MGTFPGVKSRFGLGGSPGGGGRVDICVIWGLCRKNWLGNLRAFLWSPNRITRTETTINWGSNYRERCKIPLIEGIKIRQEDFVARTPYLLGEGSAAAAQPRGRRI